MHLHINHSAEPNVAIVQLLSHVRLFAAPWTAAHQASLSITIPGACSDSCPSSRWCHPTLSSSVIPFSSCLQPFPASESFLTNQFFTYSGRSIGASTSTSVFPMNIQCSFLLRWTGLSSLQSERLSRVFSNTTVWSINSSALSLLYDPTVTSTHDHWKNHSFDYMDFCWQSNVSAF